MSDKRIKALAIKVHPKTEPNGVEFAWDKIPQLEVFTKNILIPEIAVDQDGNSAVNIGTIVSGIPSVFARANLFKNAIDNIRDKEAEASGLMLFYKSLISEWKGLISCIALNYKDIEVNRIHLSYSDGGHLNTTENIYEPTGAFGNMLFERKPLWCDQSLANNADKIPFIDVMSFKGNVIGGTSPDSFVFTSVSYQIKEKFPFINVQNGKFIDPLQSEINPQELFTLYGYAKHILDNIERFRLNYAGVEELIRPEYGNISTCIQAWMNDMVIYQQAKGYPKLDKSTSPEVGSLFNYPFGLLFNYSTELYGSEGIIYNELKEGSILFDPKDLLLPDTTEIAQIDFGREGMGTRNFLKSKPILLLAAETKGQLNSYAYFTLPLTPMALNVFGATLDALVGISESSNVKSRITAIYDPTDKDGERLIVQLKLYTETGNEIVKEVIYRVTSESISGKDILMWPNFISKQWNRYFLYSEIPHNDAKFQATPFIGNVDDDFFRIVLDENGVPLYLANNGKAAVISEKYGNIKAQLHIASNNAVADNKYKYEIYESNKPFKGVKFAHAGVDCGFGIIRYDGSGNTQALPVNMLNAPRTLSPAFLGVDFGSTNSSIAYFSDQRNEVCENLKLTNKRVSLLASDSKNNDERPAVEDEIFFFQNDEILTNSIKSVLTIHDSRRVVNDGNIQVNSLMAQAVKGGFPCFEKNLPIENAENNRYILGYNRIGRAELVYNMKWSTQQIDKSYKTAYLSTLLLHVYAQLFIEGHEPHTLKWSYPSSMGKELLSEYRGIWDSLKEISPIESNVKLKTFPPSDLSDIGDTSGSSSWGSQVAQSGGWGSQASAPVATTPAWGATETVNSGWGEQPKADVATGWGNEAKKTLTAVDIKTETGPVRFDFKKLSNEESLSEACAVANYLVRPNGGYSINPGELVLCFDIGGSTTDITALCSMEGGKAMIKQNSIRFAAERVAQATKFSPNFKNVLLRICEKKKISIQGLNSGTPKFNENTAPYYFEQVVDRLEASDFETFYLLIAAECKEMMSINLYVTGLIMFYAGQLAYKLRNEIVKSEDAPPAVKAIPPKIKIAFAGKGARIFDWFTAVNPAAADDYYTQMFIRGMGGEAVAKQTISPITTSPLKIIDINSQRGTDNADVKYEVSKGLAIPTNITSILVPTNKQAIEILGEDNFCVVTPNGEFKYLESTNSITPEMLEHIGNHFICLPQEGKSHCPRFMDFADLFYKVSSSMFGLKMNATDFMAGFQDMNIENYIKGEPDFIKAQKRKHDDQKDFDYVAPIIILEGMKFFEKHLLKGIQKQ
ncbi:hypothetical protein [Pedobacter alluvionis]|uniref:Uncharacterized protein n=1 Tax=Pedobacter alluvionis TaxID=475253 RepID=A0A497Y0W7_9SPHI|nr:hypothetical protein [Pedobacter alluvionis]RLJ73690.1 hypothetical protein BCL90_3853 [Pedobacter alluvionis]TFB32686.1 hypothetical protein E3V97_01220 [Pedobacter alluvionis]